MNVLIVLGSPRKGGNSEVLARQVGMEIQKAGGSVDYLRLNGMNIGPCQGCGGCEKTGVCVFKDDMTDLYTRVDVADILILASPVYFYNVTGQTKLFIDRFQAKWSRRYLQKNLYREDEGRRGYFIATAATRGEKMFQCCSFTVKYFFDAINMEFDYEDSLLINGVDGKGAILEKESYLREAEAFGQKIVKRQRENVRKML